MFSHFLLTTPSADLVQMLHKGTQYVVYLITKFNQISFSQARVAPIRARSCRKSRAHGFSRAISKGFAHHFARNLPKTLWNVAWNQRDSPEPIKVTVDHNHNSQQFIWKCSTFLLTADQIGNNFNVFVSSHCARPSAAFLTVYWTCVFKFLDQKAHWTEGRGHHFSGNSHTRHFAPHPFSCRRIFIVFFKSGEITILSDKERN